MAQTSARLNALRSLITLCYGSSETYHGSTDLRYATSRIYYTCGCRSSTGHYKVPLYTTRGLYIYLTAGQDRIDRTLLMATTILELSQLISNSITELVTTCSAQGLRIPNLNEPYTPESEAFRTNQVVARAANIAAAAAFQLAACLLPPQESILQVTSGVRTTMVILEVTNSFA